MRVYSTMREQICRAYSAWVWLWRDAVYYMRVSSRYRAGDIVRLRNGWLCAVVLNEPSMCVALEIMDQPVSMYLFLAHVRGAYAIGEVLAADGWPVVKAHRLTPKTLPDRAAPSVPCDALAKCKSLIGLRALLLDGPVPAFYREMLHDALCARLQAYERRAAHIQRSWRRCIADPAYEVCRRRLRAEFISLSSRPTSSTTTPPTTASTGQATSAAATS